MTYVELIVVLGIFAAMAAVSIFSYGAFQARVDIRNLASDIALKIVEAQKSASLGKLPNPALSSTWKPSYGLYFNRAVNPKTFITYIDRDNDKFYDGTGACTDECTEIINITKGNSVSNLQVFYQDGTSAQINHTQINFTRPSLTANLRGTPAFTLPVSYVQISIASPNGQTSTIQVYPSGRVQVD